jgi:outer membrane protein assembly factor BamB
MSKNKSAIAIALILMATIAVTLVALPIANAHDPPWEFPTYAYITASPNPIGIDQTVTLVFWIDQVPPGAAGLAGERWINLRVEVTAPNGDKDSLGPFTSDPVGGSWATYTPDQIGEYTFTFNFPGQVVTGSSGTRIYNYNIAINDTYLASSATTTLTVQEEEIPQPTRYPLPTEYWSRPIDGQNNEWWSISSNWLAGSHIVGRVQPDGTAPDSAHIMWTKPLINGGVVGGSKTGMDGMTYYDGTAYEQKFTSSIIMNGKLYYNLPRGNSGTGAGYVCVDLQTGEEIYWQNTTMPSFGQLYDYESINQHGVVPNGYLWATSGGGGFFGPSGPATWSAYDPLTGMWLFTLTDVPPGTNVYGPNGEILVYQLNAAGKWLAMWNNTCEQQGLHGGLGVSTNAYQWRPIGKTVNMSKAYSWNVTIPSLTTGATIVSVFQDDLLFGRTGSLPSVTTQTPYTLWAVSLKPESRGQLLWSETYNPPAGNLSRSIRQVDPETRVFAMYDQQVMQYTGYSLDNGKYLWGPTESEDALNFYALTTGLFGEGASAVAYGNLYSTGYSGIVYCYDLKNGSLLWTYKAYAGLATPSGTYSLLMTAIADGKIYLQSYEHSANAPHWVGSKMRCINATTGEEIWVLSGWGNSSPNPVADGYIVYLNAYDMQIYCIGKGPSATTVTASPKVSTNGDGVLIEGTVIDTATGTKQNEQLARFPDGVPVVSDESMGEWMEYVYCQKPMPTNVTGVEVVLETLDPNGNFYEIGRTTSDASGMFKMLWIPEVPGEYTVIASFKGSESCWGSHAETAIGVSEAPQASPTPTPPPPSMADIYIVPGIIGIIVAIVVVGLVIILMLRKR